VAGQNTTMPRWTHGWIVREAITSTDGVTHMSRFERFRRTRGFLILLFALGCFLNVPFDLGQGKYGAAAFSLFLAIGALSILPKPRHRRI
jgi:hypothetical protein